MPLSSRGKQKLTMYFGGAMVLIALWWFFIRKINWDLFVDSLKSVDAPLLLLAIVIATLTFPLRVPRWRLLLPVPATGPLATRSLWHAIAIGFTANTIIGRPGELVRAATLARLERLSFATVFASLAVERAVDGMIMVALLGLGLTMTTLPPGATMNGHPLGPLVAQAGFVAVAATLVTLAAAWKPAATLGLLRKIAPRGVAGEKFLGFAEQVLNGLSALRDPRRAFPVIGWSFLIWGVNSVAFWIGCRAFHIEIPFTASFILNGMVVVGLVFSPTPGGLGGFELALVGALALFAVDQSIASAYALGFHLSTAIPIVLLGLWSLRVVGGSLTVSESVTTANGRQA